MMREARDQRALGRVLQRRTVLFTNTNNAGGAETIASIVASYGLNETAAAAIAAAGNGTPTLDGGSHDETREGS